MMNEMQNWEDWIKLKIEWMGVFGVGVDLNRDK